MESNVGRISFDQADLVRGDAFRLGRECGDQAMPHHGMGHGLDILPGYHGPALDQGPGAYSEHQGDSPATP